MSIERTARFCTCTWQNQSSRSTQTDPSNIMSILNLLVILRSRRGHVLLLSATETFGPQPAVQGTFSQNRCYGERPVGCSRPDLPSTIDPVRVTLHNATKSIKDCLFLMYMYAIITSVLCGGGRCTMFGVSGALGQDLVLVPAAGTTASDILIFCNSSSSAEFALDIRCISSDSRARLSFVWMDVSEHTQLGPMPRVGYAYKV